MTCSRRRQDKGVKTLLERTGSHLPSTTRRTFCWVSYYHHTRDHPRSKRTGIERGVLGLGKPTYNTISLPPLSFAFLLPIRLFSCLLACFFLDCGQARPFRIWVYVLFLFLLWPYSGRGFPIPSTSAPLPSMLTGASNPMIVGDTTIADFK